MSWTTRRRGPNFAEVEGLEPQVPFGTSAFKKTTDKPNNEIIATRGARTLILGMVLRPDLSREFPEYSMTPKYYPLYDRGTIREITLAAMASTDLKQYRYSFAIDSQPRILFTLRRLAQGQSARFNMESLLNLL